MADTSNKSAYLPLIWTVLAHILFVGFSWGVLKTEMTLFKNEIKGFGDALSSMVQEMKKTNEAIYKLKEKDIELRYKQQNIDARIDRLEKTH